MHRNTFTRLITGLAWLAIVAIAYATLARVGFVYEIYYKLAPILMRPEMKTYAHFEHIIAFMLLGALFSFAYPRRLLLVCCIVLWGCDAPRSRADAYTRSARDTDGCAGKNSGRRHRNSVGETGSTMVASQANYFTLRPA